MEFLTLKQIAEMLKVSPRLALKLLSGLPCLNLGRGRGRGKRWRKTAIEEMIQGKMETPKTSPHISTRPGLASLSPNEFLGLFEGPRHVQ